MHSEQLIWYKSKIQIFWCKFYCVWYNRFGNKIHFYYHLHFWKHIQFHVNKLCSILYRFLLPLLLLLMMIELRERQKRMKRIYQINAAINYTLATINFLMLCMEIDPSDQCCHMWYLVLVTSGRADNKVQSMNRRYIFYLHENIFMALFDNSSKVEAFI